MPLLAREVKRDVHRCYVSIAAHKITRQDVIFSNSFILCGGKECHAEQQPEHEETDALVLAC